MRGPANRIFGVGVRLLLPRTFEREFGCEIRTAGRKWWACIAPAHRASTVDPVVALEAE